MATVPKQASPANAPERDEQRPVRESGRGGREHAEGGGSWCLAAKSVVPIHARGLCRAEGAVGTPSDTPSTTEIALTCAPSRTRTYDLRIKSP